MIEYILAGFGFLVAFFGYLAYGAQNNRLRDVESELEEWEGVRDVRREAESAKYDDPDSIERVRDKYNS